jgi:hypothetical protein
MTIAYLKGLHIFTDQVGVEHSGEVSNADLIRDITEAIGVTIPEETEANNDGPGTQEETT